MCARRRSEGWRAQWRAALLLQGHNTPVRNDPLWGAAVRCAFSHGRASSRQGHAIVGFAAEVQRSFQQRTGCLLSRKYPCRVRVGGLFFLLRRSAPVEESRERTEKRRCRAATVGRTFEQRRLFCCGRAAAAALCTLFCSAPTFGGVLCFFSPPPPHSAAKMCARRRSEGRRSEGRHAVFHGVLPPTFGGVLCFFSLSIPHVRRSAVLHGVPTRSSGFCTSSVFCHLPVAGGFGRKTVKCDKKTKYPAEGFTNHGLFAILPEETDL